MCLLLLRKLPISRLRCHAFGRGALYLGESTEWSQCNGKQAALLFTEQRSLSSKPSNNNEGWYDSHASGIEDNRNATVSVRAAFREIPVHPSILSYIESIGVGVRPRAKLNGRTGPGSKKNREKRRDNILLLKNAEEKMYLGDRGYRLSQTGRKKGYKGAKNMDLPEKQNVGKSDESKAMGGNQTQKAQSFSGLPPPPFAANMRPSRDDKTFLGHNIIRLPVKVLGSIGSLDEDMPRSSKGLPEVALAGRSNVGKSTLLNALLYGNQPNKDGIMPEKKFVRGKTPDRIKLPKGKKAVVSDKPGETRRITLYQLSSKILVPNDNNSGEGMSKMSLVLADLPGYGFAYASEEQSSRWKNLMQHYLLKRGKALKRILLLVDARHGLKPADFTFLENLQDALKEKEDTLCSGIEKRLLELPPIQVVLTKCDLCIQDDLARRVVQVREQLSDILRREPSSLPVMLVSAKAGLGYNNIRAGIAKGGVMELQRELAALVPYPAKKDISK